VSPRGARLSIAARLLLLASIFSAGCSTGGPGFVSPSSPYVVTPTPVGLEMLRLADVTSTDVVYDLGSGDGRLVVAAAQLFGARGVGVELDAGLISQSNENAHRAGVSDRVTFLWRDFFATDIGPATVVTLYLSEDTNLRLRPKLLRELKPGARVVSHAFTMADWRPDRIDDFQSPPHRSTLYLWVVPAVVEGTWRFTLAAASGQRRYTLRLQQRFQDIQATLSTDDAAVAVERVTLTGDRLTLLARDSTAGGPPLAFDGRVAGDLIQGEVTRPAVAGAIPLPWLARRD
jgi:SAM-dependent methyltransferase